jgi:hypothetical protein
MALSGVSLTIYLFLDIYSITHTNLYHDLSTGGSFISKGGGGLMSGVKVNMGLQVSIYILMVAH